MLGRSRSSLQWRISLRLHFSEALRFCFHARAGRGCQAPGRFRAAGSGGTAKTSSTPTASSSSERDWRKRRTSPRTTLEDSPNCGVTGPQHGALGTTPRVHCGSTVFFYQVHHLSLKQTLTMSCNVTFSQVMLCHVKSCYVTSCHACVIGVAKKKTSVDWDITTHQIPGDATLRCVSRNVRSVRGSNAHTRSTVHGLSAVRRNLLAVHPHRFCLD